MSRYNRERGWEEMPKMCQMTSPGHKGDPVYVNPVTVRYVRPGSPGHSQIYFDNDQSINVAVPVDEVIRLLNVAMNADQA